eukprot:scaffold5374_cov97-Isochrysis_galbana.AAC.3
MSYKGTLDVFSCDGSAVRRRLTYASALTGDFLGVPPSPKRPREEEQPEVRRTAQPRAWPWPGSNVTIDIRSALCCGLT